VVELEDPVTGTSGKTVIGKKVYPRNAAAAGRPELVYVSTDLALGAVNQSLREQAKPELRLTHKALVEQLRRDQRLFDAEGALLAAEITDDCTQQRRIEGKAKRCFITSRALLLGEGPPADRGPHGSTRAPAAVVGERSGVTAAWTRDAPVTHP